MRLSILLVLGILVVWPRPMVAQTRTHPGLSASLPQLAALALLGPPATGGAVAIPGPDVAALGSLARRGGRQKGEVLMIVGVAGLVTGLLIDEDIVTIAGAGVAGVGLYFYLSNR